jgi:hypothetical protein
MGSNVIGDLQKMYVLLKEVNELLQIRNARFQGVISITSRDYDVDAVIKISLSVRECPDYSLPSF